MKMAFVTTFDSHDVINWSGTPFHMANAFEQHGISVKRIGNLKRKLPPFFKLKQLWKKYAYNQRESPRFNITVAKAYSKQVAKIIKASKYDAIIAPQINPIAYLNSKIPTILWTDALYANLLNFYPGFSKHSPESKAQGHTLVKECLNRCHLAIFSSDWAAQTAIETYGINKNKIKVVPFGANIQSQHNIYDIHQFLKSRSKKTLKLLFIGKYWDRKGGDIVFNVAKALHSAGQSVEVNFVGCYPPKHIEIPYYIHCHGFISKNTEEGIKKITHLFQQSHLLFVPSRAEAYGVVFCEANAFALPCLGSQVGGIPSIIKNHINGYTFSQDTSVDHYCEYIMNLMQNYSRYEELALSSFHEYQTRLNWHVATNTVKQYISEIVF